MVPGEQLPVPPRGFLRGRVCAAADAGRERVMPGTLGGGSEMGKPMMSATGRGPIAHE